MWIHKQLMVQCIIIYVHTFCGIFVSRQIHKIEKITCLPERYAQTNLPHVDVWYYSYRNRFTGTCESRRRIFEIQPLKGDGWHGVFSIFETKILLFSLIYDVLPRWHGWNYYMVGRRDAFNRITFIDFSVWKNLLKMLLLNGKQKKRGGAGISYSDYDFLLKLNK